MSCLSLIDVANKLDAIHDHLNNSAMERITWIIIWYLSMVKFSLRFSLIDLYRLIVVACLVELVNFYFFVLLTTLSHPMFFFSGRGDRASCGPCHPKSFPSYPNSLARRGLANPGTYDGAVLSMRPNLATCKTCIFRTSDGKD